MTIPSKPEPEFRVGDAVRVRLNDYNRTSHCGHVREGIWHFKDQCYNYYLEENGKKVSKRYLAKDLEPV